jgi:hypothetical protein
MATDGQGHDIPANWQRLVKQNRRQSRIKGRETQVFLSVSSEMSRCNIARPVNKQTQIPITSILLNSKPSTSPIPCYPPYKMSLSPPLHKFARSFDDADDTPASGTSPAQLNLQRLFEQSLDGAPASKKDAQQPKGKPRLLLMGQRRYFITSKPSRVRVC